MVSPIMAEDGKWGGSDEHTRCMPAGRRSIYTTATATRAPPITGTAYPEAVDSNGPLVRQVDGAFSQHIILRTLANVWPGYSQQVGQGRIDGERVNLAPPLLAN